MSLAKASLPAVREALQAVIASLEQAVSQLVQQMTRLVQQTCPALLSLRGVGPIVAANILAESGCAERFKSRDSDAAFAGCAPLTRASGASRVVRVNPGGNRRLNWALYIIVRTRLRTEARSQTYRAKRLVEGKTQRELIRSLKTHICREIYCVLRTAAAVVSKSVASTKTVAAQCAACS